MSLRVAELESLFTANLQPFEQGANRVEQRQRALDGTRTELHVDANATSALASMDRVEASARSLPDSEFQVDADTGGAARALDDIEDEAGASGRKAGDDAGDGMSAGIVGALATIPIAGAVGILGITAAKGFVDALEDGLAVEARGDRLMAETGLDPVTVGKLARASGEAYADNWGESIASNMDIARQAIQGGLLDPDATARDSQKIISSLAGVADVIGQDVAGVARATAALLRTGLAEDAAGAFDVIVKGFQAGNDIGDDWLDTLTEYPALFDRLGIDGAEATGLINQGLEAGARNADFVADALKEFQIRATDASDASAAGYERIGLSAEDMTAKIAAGGEGAREGLQEVLDGLRDIEDPVKRNEAAVELFGTKAEDLGDSLYALDLKTVAADLGTVEGAAESAMSALTDNAQNDIETAKRNIEVATDGIKGALAGAFGPQLEEWSQYVTENRAPIMEFLLGVANGGIDIGRGFVNGIAGATESVGDFISGPMRTLLDATIEMLHGLNKSPFIDLDDEIESLEGFSANMATAGEDAEGLADGMRENLIENGLDPLQERLNEVGNQLVWEAEVHDAQVQLANEIDALHGSGEELDEQLKNVKSSLEAEAEAALVAGASNDEMKASLNRSETALREQLAALGLTEDQINDLIAEYGLVPDEIITDVIANTDNAQAKVNGFFARNQGRVIQAYMQVQQPGPYADGYVFGNATGHIVKPMAAGGVLGTPMDPIAQVVPPGTLRVVGDRMDVDEAYIPLDGSQRSLCILTEAMRRMPGVQGMAAGGINGGPAGSGIGRSDLAAFAREIVAAFRDDADRRTSHAFAAEARDTELAGRMG
ncbi:phage tail tape measure protein [Demequina sp. SO4-18]|uniref:phage tail tape measure protein n=1 Tax=Demequina sp. SO4-18 TaxID=3401026 RepID=UPI003B5AE32C